ncbi:hypothetical protein L1987_19273 [Smallanthus sonchifolius]|uniref:Uncharacterized protein n=1 Tax=Smallanthus sonchifolius TaxID=185202 RepID=A0ACB9IPE0_9ASTR|nr:hypothetical protein L1987_19273 [Smallanthus sonchifolius]
MNPPYDCSNTISIPFPDFVLSDNLYDVVVLDTIDDLIPSDHKESMVDCNEKVSKKVLSLASEVKWKRAKEFEKDENLCATPNYLICKQTSECDNGFLKTKEFEKDESLCATPKNLIHKQGSECDNGSAKDDKIPTELPNNSANVNSFETGSINLEESGSGFVSIKSKKENIEKSKQVNGVDKKRCVVSSVNKMKKKSNERVTLGDVTNIFEEHSSVTGKWKCPRKRKPDVNKRASHVGFQEGLQAGYHLCKMGVPMESTTCYDPNTRNKLVRATQDFERASFPYLEKLAACADAPLESLKSIVPH